MLTITLQEVKDHLRIDHDIFDQDLQLKINAALYRVQAHCQGTDFSKLTTEQEYLIKAAVFNLVGYLDRIRAAEEVTDRGYLPPSVHLLLAPFRELGIA